MITNGNRLIIAQKNVHGEEKFFFGGKMKNYDVINISLTFDFGAQNKEAANHYVITICGSFSMETIGLEPTTL